MLAFGLVARVADFALHVPIAIKFLGEAEAAGPALERPQLEVVPYMVKHVPKFGGAHLVANQADQRLLGTALGAHPLEILFVEFINLFRCVTAWRVRLALFFDLWNVRGGGDRDLRHDSLLQFIHRSQRDIVSQEKNQVTLQY